MEGDFETSGGNSNNSKKVFPESSYSRAGNPTKKLIRPNENNREHYKLNIIKTLPVSHPCFVNNPQTPDHLVIVVVIVVILLVVILIVVVVIIVVILHLCSLLSRWPTGSSFFARIALGIPSYGTVCSHILGKHILVGKTVSIRNLVWGGGGGNITHPPFHIFP